MLSKLEQLAKGYSPIDVTDVGIDIEVKDVHPSNAPSPIFVTEFGIDTEVKDVQLSNALVPMLVTEFPKKIDSIP